MKIISEKTVYRSKFFEVTEQNVSINEKIHKYSNVRRLPISIIFPFSDKDEIFLISQYRLFYKKRIIEAVAGHVDEGERALTAAKRELGEETGIEAEQWEEFSRVDSSASIIKSVSHFFLCKNLTFGSEKPEEGEDIKVVKMPFAQSVEMVLKGEVSNMPTAYGILLLDKLRKEKMI